LARLQADQELQQSTLERRLIEVQNELVALLTKKSSLESQVQTPKQRWSRPKRKTCPSKGALLLLCSTQRKPKGLCDEVELHKDLQVQTESALSGGYF